ncbi:MAG: twin-arginine translocation signal domain-containing protein [Dehalococcoidales bacterium]|nr:twin-arginine translocation signal domain-containing protein [Dehalococcoidales bacterium]MDD5604970.1 twin-arginine translocation signal domain-containing protein [Dehalococcoidales bacterium]NLE90205.1 twin-arginine translocation signal domain-containing protein [Dehalococcoidales bacterium]
MGSRKNNSEHASNDKEVKSISRRDFIKSAGLVTGSLTISTLAISCASAETTTNPSTSVPNTTPGIPISPTNVPDPSVLPTNPSDEFVYNPTMDYNLLNIQGCYTRVADDRLYSIDHIWVKPAGNNIVVIGVTDKMQALMDIVSSISLKDVGNSIQVDQSFGYAEGYKMNIELVSPISGTVIRKNNELNVPPYGYAEVINQSPYVKGWLLAIELNKPEELDLLLTPEEYAYSQRITDEEARDRGLIE